MMADCSRDPDQRTPDRFPRQSQPSPTPGQYTTSSASALSLTLPSDASFEERAGSAIMMDSSSDSTSDEKSNALKQKFWDRVRRSREKRCNRLMHDNNRGFGFDLCTRRTARSIIRFSYLAAACAFTSIVTLYFSAASSYSAFDAAFGAFSHPDGYSLDVHSPSYPSTFLRSVTPIPCHSHNDQFRHTPLHAALGTGCISVESDIWASPDPEEDVIFVGHDRGALLPDRTLQHMYIQPLMDILALHNPGPLSTDYLVRGRRKVAAADSSKTAANGVFALSPFTSLSLVLDFKSSSEETFPALQRALQPLIQRDWLTYWDSGLNRRIERPITIVASGNVDFTMVLSAGNSSYGASLNTTRYIFYDAPLNDLVQHGDPDALPRTEAIEIDLERAAAGTKANEAKDVASAASVYSYRYNPSNSHLASSSYSAAIGATMPILTQPDSLQRQTMAKQIRAARARGLISRYWGTPTWPRGLRNAVWESLEAEGVGLLSVDDLRGVRKGEWGRGIGGRLWSRR